MTLRSGLRFDVKPNDEIGLAIYNHERFEEEHRDTVLAHVKSGMKVLDIGANIGYYTVLFAQKVGPDGRVLAFEPNPAMFDEARHNVSINQFANVTIERIALSDRLGELSFFVPAEGRGGHGSLAQNQSFSAVDTIRVAASPLDEVLLGCGFGAVDLIKMDVEGGELAVCRGASRLLSGSRKPVIFFESAEVLCAPFGYRTFQLLALLESWGYVVKQIDY